MYCIVCPKKVPRKIENGILNQQTYTYLAYSAYSKPTIVTFGKNKGISSVFDES